jgi:hypothetical protein
MFDNHDLGAAIFSTWTDEQRREELDKLIKGHGAGLPLGILCKMAETIAGSRELAREHLVSSMPLEERQAAVEKETGGMRILAASFLL